MLRQAAERDGLFWLWYLHRAAVSNIRKQGPSHSSRFYREEWDGRGMWHVWRKGEVCTRFWWGNLRERDHWGDQDIDGRLILRWLLMKWEGVVGTGWSWLRIGTGGGRLWGREWTLGFHKMRGISWLAAKPVSFSRRTLLHGVSKYSECCISLNSLFGYFRVLFRNVIWELSCIEILNSDDNKLKVFGAIGSVFLCR